MGGRDPETLRRLAGGPGMSSAVRRGEMLQLRGVLLEDREEPHAALSDALELTRTDGLKVILGRQRRLARLRQITSHDFIPVCLQRRQPGVGNFEPSVTGHTRAIRITFGCQQAHPRGRINRARHSNGITLLERFHDIGERARPYEGRPAPDPITRQSRAGEPDPRLIRGCVICCYRLQTRSSSVAEIPRCLTGRKTFKRLKHLDKSRVHLPAVQSISRNDARVWTVCFVDELLCPTDGVDTAIRGQQHELLHREQRPHDLNVYAGVSLYAHIGFKLPDRGTCSVVEML